MNVKKMIAYQTVDMEGDVWSNKLILFESETLADEFFNNKELVFNTFEFELDEDETFEDVTLEKINSSIYYLYCQYAGKVRIQKASRGYSITN